MNRLHNYFFKRYILVLFTSLSSLTAYAQTGCDCPGICQPCDGGIISLTLKYTGNYALVSVFDNSPVPLFAQSLGPGDIFRVNPASGGKFDGNYLFFYTIFSNVTMDVSCSLEFDPSEVHGSFTIVSAVSKNGGTLCCTSNVGDTQPPVISGCPATITVDATTECSAIVEWPDPVATDCNLDTLISTHKPGSEFPIGNTTVVYTAKDFNNNTSTCSFTVTVNDKTPPILVTSPGTMTLSADANCKAKATWAPPTFTDNCGVVTLTSSPSSNTFFSLGTTEVTCTAKDNSGNTTLCKFNVIVKDQTAPVVTNCPGPITINADATCKAKATWTPPVFTDNCSSVTVISSHSPGIEFPVGTTEVTYSANDVAGNTTLCKFDVIVKDTVFPVISACPDDIIVTTTNPSGEVSVDWDPIVAEDDCALSEETASHEPGDLFPIGTTLVAYTAKDHSGNVDSCTFQVTVVYENTTLEIVQLITPDGNGVNDEWVIGNIEKYETNKVVIVDRWGSLVYSATGYNNNNKVWNGQNSNGNMVPTGTYFYTISVHSGSTAIEKKGFIELVR